MHLRNTINMVELHSGNRDGVVSMDSQVEMVPGPQPQRGPLQATGVSDPEHVAVKGRVERSATTSTSATGMLKV